MDLATALLIVSRVRDVLKGLSEIDKQLGQAELKARTATLLSDMANINNALTDAKSEIDRRDKQIERLKNAFQLREECIRIDEFLYAKNEEDRPEGNPYCPRCEQVDGLMIKVMQDEGAIGNMICPQCKMKYRDVQVWRKRFSGAG